MVKCVPFSNGASLTGTRKKKTKSRSYWNKPMLPSIITCTEWNGMAILSISSKGVKFGFPLKSCPMNVFLCTSVSRIGCLMVGCSFRLVSRVMCLAPLFLPPAHTYSFDCLKCLRTPNLSEYSNQFVRVRAFEQLSASVIVNTYSCFAFMVIYFINLFMDDR